MCELKLKRNANCLNKLKSECWHCSSQRKSREYFTVRKGFINGRMGTNRENLSSRKLACLIVCLCCFVLHVTSATKGDSCEYDMDLTRNIIKIVCEGSPASVSVYADTAKVTSEDVENVNQENTKNYNSAVTGDKQQPNIPDGQNENDQNSQKGGNNNSRDGRNGKPRGDIGRTGSSGSPGYFQKDAKGNSVFLGAQGQVFHDVVSNATQQLKTAKRGLSQYANSIKNISSQLMEGDKNLRADMENLRLNTHSASQLKEGITAAMRNQYNFMRSALLTQNYELERLMTSLNMLVDVTSDGLNSALNAHKMVMAEVSHLNLSVRAVRRMVNEVRRKNRSGKGNKKRSPQATCPKEISAIGAGTSRKANYSVGAFMVESVSPNHARTVWVVKGAGPVSQLLEYDAAIDVEYDLVGRFYSLPFSCEGTGHAIFRRHFYCHQSRTNKIVKYHLKRMDIVSEMELPGAGFGNKYPYKSGENTDVDLAVDEMGLWAIYATEDSAGKMVISKINHQRMELTTTWMTSYPKNLVGNAFVICGVLYATNSNTDTPTYIRYTYDTKTKKERLLEPGEIPFANSAELGKGVEVGRGAKGEMKGASSGGDRTHRAANSVMLSYDMRESKLISWSNGSVETFPVYFKEFLR